MITIYEYNEICMPAKDAQMGILHIPPALKLEGVKPFKIRIFNE
jgi:hypothetical protein